MTSGIRGRFIEIMESEILTESDIVIEGAPLKPHKSRRNRSWDAHAHSDLSLLKERVGLVVQETKEMTNFLDSLEEFYCGLEGDVFLHESFSHAVERISYPYFF